MKHEKRTQDRIKFTERFKLLLIERGHGTKTLGELKEITGRVRSQLHQWLNNDGIPSPNSASILCEVFDCDYEWLLTGRGSMDGFNMKNSEEVALIEQYRNMTKPGRKKIMRYAFIECEQHEKQLKTKTERQEVLKLVVKIP